MRVKRTLGLLAAVTSLAVLVPAAGASAAYRFLDSNNAAVFGASDFGTTAIFGNLGNIRLKVPAAGLTNTCSRATLIGMITSNTTGSPLAGKILTQTYSKCDSANIVTGGNTTFTINQTQSSVTRKAGKALGVDVLARNVGGNAGVDCEFRGDLDITFTNSSPMQILLGTKGRTFPADHQLAVYNNDQPGSVSNNCPLPTGTPAQVFGYDDSHAAVLRLKETSNTSSAMADGNLHIG